MIGPLANSWRASELLAEWIDVPPALDREIRGIAMDSRRVEKNWLFAACRGRTHHGIEFAGEAERRGAALILAESPARGASLSTDLPVLEVADLSVSVGPIAGRFFGNPSAHMEVVGVTGTDGKTSCAHFLAQAFSAAERRAGLIGTLGVGSVEDLSPLGHTTPDAVSLQSMLAAMDAEGCGLVAMEVSSHALDQGRVAGVHFGSAVLTNLTRDHLDYHGSVEAYGAAKRKLFHSPGLRHAVLNVDDELGRALSAELEGPQIVAYGLDVQRRPTDSHGFAYCCDLILTGEGIRFELISSWGRAAVESRLMGRFNASNLLAVFAVLMLHGFSFQGAIDALRCIRPVPGRMQCFGGNDRPLIVVDYAHTPHALDQVLGALRAHRPAGTLICVFGCGGERDRGKRPHMARAAERWADRVIVTDDNPRREDPSRITHEIMAGFSDPSIVEVVHDRRRAISNAAESALAGDTVLVAGKGHESVQLTAEGAVQFSDSAVVRGLLEAGA